MNLALKRLLYISAFIIFFLAGPLIALYSSGYRVNPDSFQLSKVGAFYVKSYPDSATILIDGEITGKTTPDRLLNVSPGLHTITITGDGFFPWEKELEVESGVTTFIRDVVLFKNNPLIKEISTGGEHTVISEDNLLYAFVDEAGAIQIINTDTQLHFTLNSTVVPEKLISFSNNDEELMFVSGDTLYAININNYKERILITIVKNTPRVHWDPNIMEKIWYIDDDAIISQYNDELDTLEIPELIDFAMTQNQLIAAYFDDSNVYVSGYTLGSKDKNWSIPINTTDLVEIKLIDSKNIVLKSDNSLWLLNLENSEYKRFDAYLFDWHDGKFIYSDGYAIEYFDIRNEQNHFIDRTSGLITNVRWHPSGSYFTRIIDGKLEIIEIDNRDKKNVVQLAYEENLDNYYFDTKGENVFIITPIQNIRIEAQ